MARTKTNTENSTKTPRTQRRNSHYFWIFLKTNIDDFLNDFSKKCWVTALVRSMTFIGGSNQFTAIANLQEVSCKCMLKGYCKLIKGFSVKFYVVVISLFLLVWLVVLCLHCIRLLQTTLLSTHYKCFVRECFRYEINMSRKKVCGNYT